MQRKARKVTTLWQTVAKSGFKLSPVFGPEYEWWPGLETNYRHKSRRFGLGFTQIENASIKHFFITVILYPKFPATWIGGSSRDRIPSGFLANNPVFLYIPVFYFLRTKVKFKVVGLLGKRTKIVFSRLYGFEVTVRMACIPKSFEDLTGRKT